MIEPLYFDIKTETIQELYARLRDKNISAKIWLDQKESPTMIFGDFWSYVKIEFDNETSLSLFAICFGDIIDNQVKGDSCQWGHATHPDHWLEVKGKEDDNIN